MKFPFSHIQIFLYAISLICHLKYVFCCFSSDFYFLDFVVLLFVLRLTLLLLTATICLFLFSFLCVPWALELLHLLSSMPANPLLFFLGTYNRDIGPAVRVFANGPGDLGSIPGRVIPKTLKMELDTTLLNTQHYKVRFKGKVEQSREWSSALPYTLV